MNEKVALLQKLIDTSQYTVAITGAGISVASGIMAFAGMNFPVVMQMTSVTVLKSTPEHYYKMARKAFLGPMFENGPTVAHQKLAQLEQQGKLQGIITTNILQFPALTLCNSANGGKALIFRRFRHLPFGRVIRISRHIPA